MSPLFRRFSLTSTVIQGAEIGFSFYYFFINFNLELFGISYTAFLLTHVGCDLLMGIVGQREEDKSKQL